LFRKIEQEKRKTGLNSNAIIIIAVREFIEKQEEKRKMEKGVI
jgi:hypothetical protein